MENNIPLFEITSISDFLEKIRLIRHKERLLWFRGQKSDTYSLLPSIYRNPYHVELEYELISRFKARAIPFLDRLPQTDWEWMFLMQHYGVPTRLLDWSEGALIALAFAVQVRKEKHKNHGAVVWALDPIALNQFSIDTHEHSVGLILNMNDYQVIERNYSIKSQEVPDILLPVAIVGPQNNRRIVAQKGVFTLFSPKGGATMETFEKAPEFLSKLYIPQESVQRIERELYDLGITETSLFPDLDAVAREIVREVGEQLIEK
ncbi:FRG domain-containing protein [Microaerobacter geothermalis]|uniref:FRG domain-containing protein n=1 Tax=Microaerobacter geothermalis TaxID=674972 RepID=UPI001F17C46A|nr:FRG domain-containing protein [Microaerobacter geothermalis]MCF6094284.1 FRG domain-containing protein [Microaerobacter geothermalis]